jgi:pyridoxal phosphate enzyme (YggS family)
MNKEKNRILEKYLKVLHRIEKAAESVGRDPKEVTLVVVTKGQPVSVVQTLIEIGVDHLGENRVEEGISKLISLSKKSDIQWHMIGHVQSRKASQVSEHFNYFHALDRVKLARRLARSLEELNRKLPVLLQFNVSGEMSKFGWLADNENQWHNLLPEISQILEFKTLEVHGLMTIAPYSLNPEDARPVFMRLRHLRDYLASQFPQVIWDQLSMGMSGDFEVGVQEGATIVRIGSAILGERI